MKPKIVFIAGAGRSGSTLLDRILGEVDGFVSVGELRQVWDHAFLGDARCGCGQPWGDCSWWSRVFGDPDLQSLEPDPHRMIACRDQVGSATLFRRSRSPRGRSELARRMAPLLEVLTALYAAVAREGNGRVIVDSSKFASYGILLSLMESVDLYVIHMVRDPRAHAYSWSRAKAYLEPIPSHRAATTWIRSNLTAQHFLCPRAQGSTRVRLEDLVAHPLGTMQGILDLVGESGAVLPDLSNGVLKFGVNHTVGGNPDRFASGETRLQLDERWRENLAPPHRTLVNLLTWPWLLRYGYRGAKP